jgi:hypothetical protein
MSGGPPEDAYGRVTNPERYRPLHDAARDLLDELVADYEVERLEGVSVDEELASKHATERLVRLTPAVGAPLTVSFTAFPGVIARYGRWVIRGYPVCGCDACDEDPEDLVEDFTAHVETLVEGGFSEEITASGWLEHRFEDSSGGGQRLIGDAASWPAGRADWPAWPAR